MPSLRPRPAHDYRPDIDGLRALAILPVVLFHAHVPGFSGGFVGVDVFFVISGFLITAIIDRELRAGHFTITRFYERRARRILPALFVVMACCSVLAAILLFPNQYLAYARSLIAATLFVSSFLFRREDGYFDLTSDEKPLLHTWSLSVEEIYYVFFPLMLIWAWRLVRDRRLLVLIAVGLLSFIASVGGLYLDPTSKSVFFLPHFRAWEFLLGATIALASPRLILSQRIADAASAIGVLMILVAVFAYSGETVFPGLAALLPCAGAALVIAAGRGRETLAGKGLASPAVVFIGLISYSLYLWHWPLLVFARAYLGADLQGWQAAMVILLSLALATVTWRFVERPFRGKGGLLSKRQLLVASILGMLLFVGIGLHGILTRGWISRYPVEVVRILFAGEDKDPRQDACMTISPSNAGCLYGATDATARFALWGDSHAAVQAVMLGELAREHGSALQVFTMPACPPLVGWKEVPQPWGKDCTRFQELAYRRILESPQIETVLLAANYVKYGYQDGTFAQALDQVVGGLRASGKKVVLIDPTPQLEEEIPLVLSRKVLAGKTPTTLTQPLSEYLASSHAVTDFLDRIARRHGATRVFPQSRLCDARDCYFYRDKTVYYYDAHHLSLSGSAYLRPLFEPLFDARGQSRRDP
ncbi:acyltransferase family protein [Thiocystis violacea]|uniref:acyltransferase family protein n=1 Tax=Thiocystis violacea TaxID=13725 RepID=UPI0019082AE4|nr:acyltransferase family protein [Thiocystis violacea]MBK1723915.1 hypothetical protein [Thiocystis violacea]